MELICKKKVFEGKDGKEKTTFNYYVKTDSGYYIAVKPVFDDYKQLRAISTLEE